MPEPPPTPPPSGDPNSLPAVGFLSALAAVFSSFLGIRRRSAGERDMGSIKLVHVIVAGLLGAALFVAVLVTLVTFITRHA